jgi:hypothetical protein
VTSSAANEVSFSEFLQHPTKVTSRLDRERSLRIHRRGAPDLVLMSADRADRELQVAELIGRLFAELLRDSASQELTTDAFLRVLPWARFLPTNEVRLLVKDLWEVASASASIGNFAPVAQLLTEWRHTAEIHADPELAQALSGPYKITDGATVPRPEGGDGE